MAEAPRIELRLSYVDPPAADPRKTIYRDIVDLPDPTYLGITMRYFNYDDVGLYFRVTGSAPGYTFGTVDLGLLASGANKIQNLDNFGSRSKPAAELTEDVKLILRAYTDAGYTNLKWTYERVVTVIWIDSSDPSYTVDALNNFDDGTLQGWACVNVQNVATITFAVATDYVLSAPYSARAQCAQNGDGLNCIYRIYKSFTTPNRAKVYAIINFRLGKGSALWCHRNVTTRRDDLALIYLGQPYVAVEHWDTVPVNKWMREVVPLPPNATFELRLDMNVVTGGGLPLYWYTWLDDFKIISKD